MCRGHCCTPPRRATRPHRVPGHRASAREGCRAARTAREEGTMEKERVGQGERLGRGGWGRRAGEGRPGGWDPPTGGGGAPQRALGFGEGSRWAAGGPGEGLAGLSSRPRGTGPRGEEGEGEVHGCSAADTDFLPVGCAGSTAAAKGTTSRTNVDAGVDASAGALDGDSA
eukprot:XP_008680436.2 uncharacterized protein LOC103655458 [Zea mays]